MSVFTLRVVMSESIPIQWISQYIIKVAETREKSFANVPIEAISSSQGVRGGGFRSATPIAGDNKGAGGGVHPSCAGTVDGPAPFRRCDIEVAGNLPSGDIGFKSIGSKPASFRGEGESTAIALEFDRLSIAVGTPSTGYEGPRC
ncbi:hypothetical protein EDD22DRAFT_843843 [Suillus occidentalis]|nr:hypothetical protein EDD22DRAFT_843843 [Suillus occidentalis]